jgi:hypothetical protein
MKPCPMSFAPPSSYQRRLMVGSEAGRVGSAETGSREPSPDGLGPTGFDPARIAALRELLDRASPLPWEEGWNTRWLGDGYESMCGRGPDTIALKPDHPSYQARVVDQAFADAALIAAAVNALPELLAIAAEAGDKA